METITHNFAAIIIEIYCVTFFIFPLNVILTMIFAFLSHVFLDAFSIITYHTPDAQKEDRFWLIWHIVIYALSAISIIIFIVPYWISLLFANIMDIWDWFILRPIQRRREKKGLDFWGKKMYFHITVDWVRNTILKRLPRRNYEKGGIIIEIIIIIGLFIWIILLNGFSFLI